MNTAGFAGWMRKSSGPTMSSDPDMTAPTLESLFAITIRRRLVRTVLIKDSKAFDRLYRELQTALTKAWDDETGKAIVAALDRLRDSADGG